MAAEDAEALERRRTRLYRPGASTADVDAYRRLTESGTAPLPTPSLRRRPSVGPIAVVAGVLLAAGAAIALLHGVGPPTVRAEPLLDAAGQRSIARVQASGGGATRLGAAVLAPVGLLGNPSVTVLQRAGTGAADLPVGTLGTITQGRRIRLIVVTDGPFTASLVDGSRVLARVEGDGGARATGATVDLPAAAAHAVLRMEVPAGRRFACFLAMNG